MSQRTTVLAVQTLLETNNDYRSGKDLQQFIDSATVVVDRVQAMAISRSKTLTAGELELIERWLSGHFYAMLDQTYSSKSTNGASGSFHGQTGMKFEATKYGQTALSLDYSGSLDSLQKRQTASCSWLGVTETEALDYEDRQ